MENRAVRWWCGLVGGCAWLLVALGGRAPALDDAAIIPALIVVSGEEDAAAGDGLWLRAPDGALRRLVDGGALRDPAVAPDARRVAFAWRPVGSAGFRLQVVDLATGTVTPVTTGERGDDVAPAWLPNGELVFRSTRMVQAGPDGGEAGNLFVVATSGRFLRRLTWDQQDAGAPRVMGDGRILYGRWEGLVPQPHLIWFTMNPDGTHQRPWYGWVAGGYATLEAAPALGGEAALVCGDHAGAGIWLVDRLRGQRWPDGAQPLAAPGATWRHPVALADGRWLAMRRAGRNAPWQVMVRSGLGVWETVAMPADRRWRQAVPVEARTWTGVRPSTVDQREASAFIYLQDVGRGDGLPAGRRAHAATVRVIAITWPLAGSARQPASTILGTVPLEADGSLFAKVPARTPLRLQVLGRDGALLGSMRSWMALQPGERLSCTGCHTDPAQAPPPGRVAAFLREPRAITPSAQGARALDFTASIHPILQARCASCHDGRAAVPVAVTGGPAAVHARMAAAAWLSASAAATGPARRMQEVLDGTHGQVRLSAEEREIWSCWLDAGAPGPQPPLPAHLQGLSAAWSQEEGRYLQDLNLTLYGTIEQ